jgi:protein FAM32A
MPASDYTSTISGGLKLKGGAKDAGVKKKSKKSKSSKDKAPKPSTPQADPAEPEAGDSKTDLALTTTPSSRDATPSDLLQPSTSSGTSSGKTEAQRRHEEIKRKRVRQTFPPYKKKKPHTYMLHATGSHKKLLTNILCELQLDDRLKREGGAKTHKQRVEELNKYLSTLSEHHDMPRIGPG